MTGLLDQLDALQREFNARVIEDPILGGIVDGSISRAELIAVYREIWHCARQTPVVLGIAARSFELLGSEDPRFAGPEYARFKTPLYRALERELWEHSAEERGHDDWMLGDLVALGDDAAAVRGSSPGPAMAAYIACFQHAARGPAPLGVAGQAFILEGVGVQLWGDAVETLIARSPIPEIADAVVFLRRHAVIDVEHCARARERLARLEDPRDRAAIVYNARATVESWGRIGHDILRRRAA